MRIVSQIDASAPCRRRHPSRARPRDGARLEGGRMHEGRMPTKKKPANVAGSRMTFGFLRTSLDTELVPRKGLEPPQCRHR